MIFDSLMNSENRYFWQDMETYVLKKLDNKNLIDETIRKLEDFTDKKGLMDTTMPREQIYDMFLT